MNACWKQQQLVQTGFVFIILNRCNFSTQCMHHAHVDVVSAHFVLNCQFRKRNRKNSLQTWQWLCDCNGNSNQNKESATMSNNNCTNTNRMWHRQFWEENIFSIPFSVFIKSHFSNAITFIYLIEMIKSKPITTIEAYVCCDINFTSAIKIFYTLLSENLL